MDVLCDVATIVNSGKSRADVKIHVSQEAMLRIVSAYAHSPRISLLDFDVDIADRRIKRTRVRIRWRGIRVRPAAREEQHVRGPLLKTRRVCGQHERRPRSPKADYPDSGPDVNRPG